MSIPGLFIAALLATLAATAHAQLAPSADKTIDNRLTFGAAANTKAKIIIPSDNKGVTGLGRGSELTAQPNVAGAFITNAKYGAGGVMRPFVSNITIRGGQPKPDFDNPPGDADQKPVVAHGVMLDGVDWRIQGCLIQSFWGTGAQGQTTGRSLSNPNSGEVRDNDISHCFTGIKVANSDTIVSGNTVAYCRDYCLHVTNSAGGVQSNGNHYYAAFAAIYNEKSGGFQSTDDKFSDARYGYLGGQDAHNARFTNSTSIHCNIRNMWLRAPTHLVNPAIDVWKNGSVWSDKVGVEITGPRCTILGGHIDMNWWQNPNEEATGPATAAIKLGREEARPNWGADDCVIETRIHGHPQVAGEKGVWVTAPIAGGRFELFVYGFDDAGDSAVVIDAAARASKGTTWVIRGPTQTFVTFPDDLDRSNTISTIDSTTGETKKLWPK